MNITNNQYEILRKALWIPRQEGLTKEQNDAIEDAQVVLMELYKKKQKDNKRISKYVAEKRKVDKNYAR